MHDGGGLWNYVTNNVVFNIKMHRIDTNTLEKNMSLMSLIRFSWSTLVLLLALVYPHTKEDYKNWTNYKMLLCGLHKGLESRTSWVLLEPWCFPCNTEAKWKVWFIFTTHSKHLIIRQIVLLTRVFPFDVGQVGRAGVADGQTLLGHTLITIHVHEVSRHGDLRGHSKDIRQGSLPPSTLCTNANQHHRTSMTERVLT